MHERDPVLGSSSTTSWAWLGMCKSWVCLSVCGVCLVSYLPRVSSVQSWQGHATALHPVHQTQRQRRARRSFEGAGDGAAPLRRSSRGCSRRSIGVSRATSPQGDFVFFALLVDFFAGCCLDCRLFLEGERGKKVVQCCDLTTFRSECDALVGGVVVSR